MARNTLLFSTLLAGVAACASSAPPEPRPFVDETPPPAQPEPRFETIWEYVAATYDADGSGRVSRAEYTREGGVFEALDRNGDGDLAADDFADDSALEIEMRTIGARTTLARFLQDDDDASRFTLDELFLAAEAFDADADELLEEDEFRALAAERRQEPPADTLARMFGDTDPWSMLVDGIDEDADGAIGFDELGAFFERHDEGDFVWDLSVEREAPSEGEPTSGPKVGSVAPDFELEPPGGGLPVRLSSFRGDRPVALIFGSAT